jgi:single-stranded-DNA-specific exonuclease
MTTIAASPISSKISAASPSTNLTTTSDSVRWAPRKQDSLISGTAAVPADLSKIAAELHREVQLPEVLARLLAERGIQSAEQARGFLNPKLSDLHSPYLMCGMREAVDRLSVAIESKERILIYGDYDVDGTMATVILKTAVELLGGTCDFHVPHRLLEGYGMRDEVIERAAEQGIRLIISVDTGIRAFAAAETAKRLGLDLIVTDHHLPHDRGNPEALAVLNPNQQSCPYPTKGLCGAGVAFKVAQALLEKNGRERLIPSFLKVVAIATIADSVPLIGENRVFVRLGLEGLRNPVNPGLRSLLEICELNHGRPLTSTEIAFRIAPRMNAAGRMDVAKDVIELFSVKDKDRARELAEKLNGLNIQRQQEELRINDDIRKQIDDSDEMRNAFCMVVDGDQWHRGIIGICASRVVDRYARPALVISRDGEEAHGSGRSFANFHLLEALESCSELFTRFGGHAHAVGFALRSEKVPELRARLDAFARERLKIEELEPVMEFDGELALDQLTPAFWQALQQLQPFGMGNPEPIFVAREVRAIESRILKEKHLKLKLNRYGAGQTSGGLSRSVDALGWRMADRLAQSPITGGDRMNLAFRLELNNHPDFGGGLQLILQDFTLGGTASSGG